MASQSGKNSRVTILIPLWRAIESSLFLLQVEKADVCNSEELVPHMTGSDVVMSCLGYQITFFTAQTFYSESCKAIIDAMRKAGVKRFIAITSWCTVCKLKGIIHEHLYTERHLVWAKMETCIH